MSKITLRTLGVALFAATMIACGSSAGAASSVACGAVITENTVLTQDLLNCENGLVIAAPNVTLDLGRHEIRGLGAGVGVRVQAAGAVVTNGTVSAFDFGVQIDDEGSNATVLRLVLAENRIGLGSDINPTVQPAGPRIEGNTIRSNQTGVQLIYLSGETVIVGNRVVSNQQWGVSTVYVTARVEGNVVTQNGDHGIYLDTSHSAVTSNTISSNGGDGLFIYEESPCQGHLNLYRVGGNVADRNGRLGIHIYDQGFCPPGTEPYNLLDAGGNTATRNGDPRQCTIHVKCAGKRGKGGKGV